MKRPSGLLIAVFLVACGGGGDDASNPPDSGSGTPNPGTETRPDFAQPVYSGPTSKAVVDHDSATDIAAKFALALAAVRDYADDGYNVSIPRNEIVDESQDGPNGGSVRIQGRGDSTRHGWLTATFQQYAADGMLINGAVTEHRLRDHQGFEYTAVSYHGLRLRAGTLPELRIDGTVTYVSAGQNPLGTNTYNLSMTAGGDSLLMRDLVAVFDTPAGHFTAGQRIALTGDVIHSSVGLFTVRTDVPMALSLSQTDRVFTGKVQLTGEGAVRMMPLNNHFVALEYAEVGGDFTRALRREWRDLFGAFADATPALVADPGPRETWTSMPIELDARFSYGGVDGIEHTWSLVFGAPGEHAWLDHPQGTVVGFEPGGPGEYLFRLTSTDGVTTRSSYVIHSAVEGWVADPPPFRERRQVGPSRDASVGDEVEFETRLFVSRSGDPPWAISTWTIESPAASGVSAATVSGDGETVSFEPDVAGIYTLFDASIFVDTPRYYAPAVNLNVEDGSPTGQNKRDVAEIRVGAARALLYLAGHHSGLGKLFMTELDEAGSFRPTVVLGEYTMQRLLVVDLDGDGLEDIVGVDGWEMTVLDQQPDGTFVARAPIAYGPGGEWGCSSADDVVIGDLFERGDRVLAVTCREGIYTFDVSPTGNIAAGVLHSMPIWLTALLTADLDGSGRGTLVFTHGRVHPIDAGFMVLHGNPDGSFDAPVAHTAGAGISIPPLVKAGDLNGNGRDELVATTHGNLIVVEHDAGGAVVQTHTHAFLPIHTPSALVVADFDGQGGDEVAFASTAEKQLRMYTFDAGLLPSDFVVPFSTTLSPSPFVQDPLRTWDFNGDGLPDLLIATLGAGLEIHLAEGPIDAP